MSETATATRSHKWRKEQLTEPVQTEWGGLPVIIHERWVAQAWGFTLTLTREERLLWEDVRGGWYLTVEGGDLECAMTEEVGSFHWDARRATTSEFARKRVSWCKNQWRKNQSAPKTCTDCLQPLTPSGACSYCF